MEKYIVRWLLERQRKRWKVVVVGFLDSALLKCDLA
jgi:hypothetical protein